MFINTIQKTLKQETSQRNAGESEEAQDNRGEEKERKTTRGILSAARLESSSCVRPVPETCAGHTS